MRYEVHILPFSLVESSFSVLSIGIQRLQLLSKRGEQKSLRLYHVEEASHKNDHRVIATLVLLQQQCQPEHSW